MFLAFNELKQEKLRYIMIIIMLALLSYLIFILTSLTLGLANENTAAITGWNVKTGVLEKSSDANLRQSLLTADQVKKLTKDSDTAVVAETSVVTKDKGASKISATFVGLNKSQFIAKELQITSGRKAKTSSEIVMDDSFQNKDYKLGQKVSLNDSSKKYKIIGFTHDAKLNIAPIVYGSISTWQNLREIGTNFGGSGIFSKKADFTTSVKSTKAYTLKEIINKLPGYSSQNMTFSFIIGFLMIISLVIVAVFLYIITLQKLPNYAVLRAQGVPSGFLIRATLAQSLILMIFGLIAALILVAITALAMPADVPMTFNLGLTAAVSAAMIIMAIIGALIPVRMIAKVDPVSVIGG